jgi:hypothetical protein
MEMAGIGQSNELSKYLASEWKADVGYLVREFEIQKELEKSKKQVQFNNDRNKPTSIGNGHFGWLFGKRHSPR